MTRFYSILLALGLSAFALYPSGADASLKTDRLRVERAATGDHATLLLRQTLFLEQGQMHALEVPIGKGCVSVVALAERSTNFAVLPLAVRPKQSDLQELARSDSRLRVLAQSGAVLHQSCGDLRLTDALITMVSTRAAVELLVFSSALPIEGLHAAIAREAPPVVPAMDLGPPLMPAPLKERRRRAEARARAEGATNVLPLEMEAGDNGTGEIALRLPAGCHRLDVMPDVVPVSSGPFRGIDLDADLKSADGRELLARDRGETPDARLDTCVGETTMLSLLFRGAPPAGRVLLHDAFFPLPKWAEDRFGPRVLAGQIQATRRRLGDARPSGLLFESLGAQGSTISNVPVERGRCYLATVAISRGSSRGLRLLAQASETPSWEEVPSPDSSAAVTFCSDTDVAEVTVDAPGVSVSWVLSVFTLFERPRALPEGGGAQ